MKTIVVVAAALLLAACGTDSGWVPDEAQSARQMPLAPAMHVASAPAPLMTPPPPAPPPPIETPAPEVPQAPPQIAASPVSNPVDTHCRTVAHQRAADARANGFSFEMSDIVYDGTYKDCVAWQAQHSDMQ